MTYEKEAAYTTCSASGSVITYMNALLTLDEQKEKCLKTMYIPSNTKRKCESINNQYEHIILSSIKIMKS